MLNIISEAAKWEQTISSCNFDRWHMIFGLTLFRKVLLENLDNYPKSSVTKNLLRPAFGESLFIAEGVR